MKKVPKTNLTNMGFVFKDNGDVKDFNGNIYASQITEDYDLLYSRDGTFYNYFEGVYNSTSDTELRNQIMQDFDGDAPNMWKPSYERL